MNARLSCWPDRRLRPGLRRCSQLAGAVVCLGLTAAAGQAQWPAPRLDRLFPLGVSAAGSLEVTLDGADLDNAERLLFAAPGLTAERLDVRKFRVQVAADVPPGSYDVWAAGPWGVSNPKVLWVSQGLAELVEQEPNDLPEQAQAVPLDSAVSGQFDGDNIDWFAFPAQAGQRITLDLQAVRVDSKFDGVLELRSPRGAQLAVGNTYFGRDAFLDLVAAETGDYVVGVHDLTFRGGSQYRLVVSQLPQVEAAFPRAVSPGLATEVTLLGRNLGPQAHAGSGQVEGLPLDELPLSVQLPADPAALLGLQLVEHGTELALFPCAALATVRGAQVRPALPGVQGAALLLAAPVPPQTEVEPNDTPQTAQPLTLPALVNGRQTARGDADWFAFTVPPGEGGVYSFEVYAARIGGRCDPILVIQNDQGGDLGEHDDYGVRSEAFEGRHEDPFGQATLEENKSYRVLVLDRFQRGGPRMHYVLYVRKERCDFHVAAIPPQPQQPAGLCLPRGGATYVDLFVQHDGYEKPPVRVEAVNLPAGWQAAPALVRDDPRGVLVLWSTPDAAEFVGPLQLRATAELPDLALERPVRAFTRLYEQQPQQPAAGSSRIMQALPAASGPPAPLWVRSATDRLEIPAGQQAEVRLVAERRAGDTGAAIALAPLAASAKFKLGASEIPAGQSELVTQLAVEAGTPSGEYQFTLQATTDVQFVRDPAQTDVPISKYATPLPPIRIVVPAAP